MTGRGFLERADGMCCEVLRDMAGNYRTLGRRAMPTYLASSHAPLVAWTCATTGPSPAPARFWAPSPKSCVE